MKRSDRKRGMERRTERRGEVWAKTRNGSRQTEFENDQVVWSPAGASRRWPYGGHRASKCAPTVAALDGVTVAWSCRWTRRWVSISTFVKAATACMPDLASMLARGVLITAGIDVVHSSRDWEGKKKGKKKALEKFGYYDKFQVYARRVNPSALAFSLSSHRHSYVSLLFSSRFSA